jgi:hypothetical protein
VEDNIKIDLKETDSVDVSLSELFRDRNRNLNRVVQLTGKRFHKTRNLLTAQRKFCSRKFGDWLLGYVTGRVKVSK